MSRASATPTPASPASQASAPLAVHGLDWQQALLDLPASATPAQRDAVVADWAQRCWQDLCLALPQQRHVVLAHPGQLQERARICFFPWHFRMLACVDTCLPLKHLNNSAAKQ